MTPEFLLNFNQPLAEIADTPVYRIFSLEKFITSLSENKLSLIKTKLWEDPFEAFLLKQLIWESDGSRNYPFEKRLVENFYGQCWTFLKESNLLWKAYAPNTDGVMVKSTIGRIYELYVKNQPKRGSFFLGKVDYWPEIKIKQHYESEASINGLMSDAAEEIILESLFIKREAFKHEEELRLIYYSDDVYGECAPITKHGYIPEKLHLFNELAEELILDPKIDTLRSQSIIDLIRKLGYEGEVKKSTLFDVPRLTLRTTSPA